MPLEHAHTATSLVFDFSLRFTLPLWWQDDTAEALAELHDRDLLLAYQFPSKAAGPMGGGQEVHVFHKCAFKPPS